MVRRKQTPTITYEEGRWTISVGGNGGGQLVVQIVSATGAIVLVDRPQSSPLLDTELKATEVAKAILSALYGPALISGQLPFHVASKDGNWLLEGSRPPGRYEDGGTASVRLRKLDGAVLGLSSGR